MTVTITPRYTNERALLNVQDMVNRTGVVRREVAEACGLSESQFSQKFRSVRNRFTTEEFGRLAEFFSQLTGKPLTGWPFYDELFCDVIDGAMASVGLKANPKNGPKGAKKKV